MAKPLVAIVGRPNVGKSLLFNKLVGRRIAIVEDTPGVTRDRLYETCDWAGREFMLVDTGGIEPNTDSEILKFMRRQAEIAIETADVIIMVTDVQVGVTAADADVADMLLHSGKPIVLAVNKCDSIGLVNPDVYEFYNLGLGDPIEVSAVHGHGTGDLLDACIAHFPPAEEEELEDDYIQVAIVGKPNVGKSALMNMLSGFSRSIVTDIAGTTRDVVEETVRVGSVILRLADTAGIRESADVVESIGVDLAKTKIERAGLILAVFDSSAELDSSDKEIFELCKNRDVIAIINKIDLPCKADIDYIKNSFSETVFISAKAHQGEKELTEAIERVLGTDKIDTSKAMLTTERQRLSAISALKSIDEALAAINIGMTMDAVNVCIDTAIDKLLELTGKRAKERVVDEVFSRFCVGK